MTVETLAGGAATRRNVANAVRRNRTLSTEGLQERLFSFLFSGLVYAQIWEDPVVDLEALDIGPGSSVATIASGGCNALSYLTRDPARILAVDLNFHHIALNRLKRAGAEHLPDHAAFLAFFGRADAPENAALYDAHLRDRLPDSDRDYWNARDWRGRRRIERYFGSNVYSRGLLGRFIGAGHKVARLHGKDPARMLGARDLDEQRALFERELRPVLRSRLVRFLVDRPSALYGLGIPPAQYKALLSSAPEGGTMADVLEARLERLACGFPLAGNYFAWQAFGRRYAGGADAALPPYLAAENFDAVRARAGRIELRHGNLIDALEAAGPGAFDAYVLLDAQDWMGDETLDRLWRAIQRSARPGARVIFRTAAEPSLLPGRLAPELLARWDYAEAESRAWTLRDRSAIYGGFHLYRLKAEA
jgi:S-adenosylmethionine-diacylglycerol 3-amino-3-carboxypropyl transferase